MDFENKSSNVGKRGTVIKQCFQGIVDFQILPRALVDVAFLILNGVFKDL